MWECQLNGDGLDSFLANLYGYSMVKSGSWVGRWVGMWGKKGIDFV